MRKAMFATSPIPVRVEVIIFPDGCLAMLVPRGISQKIPRFASQNGTCFFRSLLRKIKLLAVLA